MQKFVNQFVKFKIAVIFPLMHIFVLSGLISHEHWLLILISGLILFYPMHNLGQSIGIHRLFSHKSFRPNKWFPYLSAVVSSITFYGDPLKAALIHRLHHKYSDTDLDPHSPKDGIWHAYIGWVISYKPKDRDIYEVRDLLKEYPWLIIFGKWEWAIFLIFHLGLYLISPGVFYAVMLSCLLSFNCGLLLNAFSHRKQKDGTWAAVNNLWLSKYINPTFYHEPHHGTKVGEWDYGYGKYWDFSAWFIQHLFAKNPKDLN